MHREPCTQSPPAYRPQRPAASRSIVPSPRSWLGTGEPMKGLTSGRNAPSPSIAGRGHPSAWLSSLRCGRALALANEPMKISSSARWFSHTRAPRGVITDDLACDGID